MLGHRRLGRETRPSVYSTMCNAAHEPCPSYHSVRGYTNGTLQFAHTRRLVHRVETYTSLKDMTQLFWLVPGHMQCFTTQSCRQHNATTIWVLYVLAPPPPLRAGDASPPVPVGRVKAPYPHRYSQGHPCTGGVPSAWVPLKQNPRLFILVADCC